MGSSYQDEKGNTYAERPEGSSGKGTSRCNALKHGLTSTKLLPEVLNKDRVGVYRRKFEQQYLPDDPTMRILIDEMARHAAMLELGERAEASVLRHGARELSQVILGPGNGSNAATSEREDAIITAAVSTDALDKFNRYRRGHEKAFYAALKKLREILAERGPTTKADTNKLSYDEDCFATEDACEKYLVDRFRLSNWRCPRCENIQGSWLTRRNRWECAKCRQQTGLRYGTIMQGSRLSLRIWFRAITIVLRDPGISTGAMAEALGVNRLNTVRSLLSKIRGAVESENATELLAGLVT